MSTSTGDKRRVAIYVRISKDPEGLELGVARQEKDCREHCAKRGWTIVEVFGDDDISASTISRKRRPGYEKLLAGTREGRWDIIVSYSNSRLTRRPLELEDLIQLHEATGVMISTIVSGDANLSTADGRLYARLLASIDAAEAERTAERVKRTLQERRTAGLPTSGHPRFGYLKPRHGGTYTPDPALSDVLANAYRRITNGEITFRRLAMEWNALGIGTVLGGPWRPQALRAMMCTGFAAGLIREHSKPNHETRNQQTMNDFDSWRPGSHEAIITMDEWNAFRARCMANTEGVRKWVWASDPLAGLLLCGLCEGEVRMVVANSGNNTHRRWTCPRRRDYGDAAHPYIHIPRTSAEEIVLTWIDQEIGEGQNLAGREAEQAKAKVALNELEQIDRQIGALKAKRRRVADLMADDAISIEDGKAQRAEAEQEIAHLEALKLEKSLLKVQSASPLPAFTTLREEWGLWDAHKRREALARLVRGFVVVPPVTGTRSTALVPLPRWGG